MDNNLDVYRQTGKLLEKYDVEHVGALATGGEDIVQDGFGWTNAILLKFMNYFGVELSDEQGQTQPHCPSGILAPQIRSRNRAHSNAGESE